MSADPQAVRRCRVVVVCRGCCCGTATKHPGADHQAQIAQLAAMPAGHAAQTVSACLGRCEDGNNIVVIPSPVGRRNGGTTVGFGRMLTLALTEAVTAWVAAGGPGVAPMPHILVPHGLNPLRPATSITVN
jgi:hypothetical protein